MSCTTGWVPPGWHRAGLQASHNLLTDDPQAASTLIDQMVLETERRVDGVRAMARDPLPPTLEADGLVPALEELAALHRSAGVEVRVDARDSGGVSAQAATAAYAIASEAVRDVVRHSGARTCRITISTVDGERLRLEIVDDGTGIEPEPRRGVGLTSAQSHIPMLMEANA